MLSLERILVSKLAANRAKDQLTIPVLRDALATTTTIQRCARKRKGNERIAEILARLGCIRI
ncbi:MAG: hypothetical protein L0Z50_11460 [Verrucomicrobiales bacterium]|nr:hypothetical protein [Verrucomicrobiales bacterium]